jgi:hypothetical protein
LAAARIPARGWRTLLPRRLLPLVGAAEALPAAPVIRLLLLRLLPRSLLPGSAGAVSRVTEPLPAATIILLPRSGLLGTRRLLLRPGWRAGSRAEAAPSCLASRLTPHLTVATILATESALLRRRIDRSGRPANLLIKRYPLRGIRRIMPEEAGTVIGSGNVTHTPVREAQMLISRCERRCATNQSSRY